MNLPPAPLSSRGIIRAVRPRPLAASAGALLFSIAALAPHARATDRTWNDSATDFNAGGSWGGTAPGTGDAALFPTDATISFQPNLTANLTIQQIRFGATDTTGYTLSATSPFKLTLSATSTTVGGQ